MQVAKSEIRNAAAKYTAFQFFFNRTDIGNAMGDALARALLPLGAFRRSRAPPLASANSLTVMTS